MPYVNDETWMSAFGRSFLSGPLSVSGAKLGVSMTYTDAFGRVKTTTMGTLSGSGTWDVSHSLGIPQRLTSPTVQFTLTVTGSGPASFEIDDFYIDPYFRG